MSAEITAAPSKRGDTCLVLILHAFNNTPASMAWVEKAVADLRPQSHIVIQTLPLKHKSFAQPLSIARNLLALVEGQISYRKEQSWEGFHDIVFIGHSMGALLA